MEWILLTGISVLFRSVYGIMTKVLSNRLQVTAYTQATILPLAGAIIALVFSPFFGGLSFDFTGVSVITILLVILGQGFGNILYFTAIKHLTNGTAQITFSSVLVFNTILALLFTGLHLSLINVCGIFLLLLAILVVVNGKVELNKRGILLMILAAFFFSIFQIASSEISSQISAATYLLFTYLGAALIVFLLKARVIIQDLKQAKSMSVVTIPLITALPSLGTFLFAFYAFREAPEPAKVAMLLTSQVVLTVILSYFLLREKDHVAKKLSAAVLVVISAVLIKD